MALTFPTQVEMSWDSFNRGDVFLLDLGMVIIQWNGPESNSGEQLKVSLSPISSRPRAGLLGCLCPLPSMLADLPRFQEDSCLRADPGLQLERGQVSPWGSSVSG